MTNADVILQLDALAGEVDALRQDLKRSPEMEAVPAAHALVKAVKVKADFARLAKQARKDLGPLFGADDQGGDKPRPRPRK